MTAFTDQFNAQGRRCFYCYSPLTRSQATEDHYIPKSKSGPLDWSNKVISCKPCNFRKLDTIPTVPLEQAKARFLAMLNS